MMTLRFGPTMWPLPFFLIYLLSSHIAAYSLSLNYVPPETRLMLANQFETTHQPLPLKIKSSWNCEMFGMRTGLQHEKNIALYNFHGSESGKIKNQGLSPNALFESNQKKTELVAKGRQVTEYVRFISNNELISKLTHTHSNKTLAFAKCRKGSHSLTKGLQKTETIAVHD